jgi:hypothetical protein
MIQNVVFYREIVKVQVEDEWEEKETCRIAKLQFPRYATRTKRNACFCLTPNGQMKEMVKLNQAKVRQATVDGRPIVAGQTVGIRKYARQGGPKEVGRVSMWQKLRFSNSQMIQQRGR